MMVATMFAQSEVVNQRCSYPLESCVHQKDNNQ